MAILAAALQDRSNIRRKRYTGRINAKFRHIEVMRLMIRQTAIVRLSESNGWQQ
jgi:hypothetical protein